MNVRNCVPVLTGTNSIAAMPLEFAPTTCVLFQFYTLKHITDRAINSLKNKGLQHLYSGIVK